MSAPSTSINLTASDGDAGNEFGYSVAIDGDTLVVGAYKDNNANGDRSGSTYIFIRSGTNWREEAKLTASDGAANDWFGKDVAI